MLTVHYIHARFHGDKYKLHHQKVMCKVLGLIPTKRHVPPPPLPFSKQAYYGLNSNQYNSDIIFKS